MLFKQRHHERSGLLRTPTQATASPNFLSSLLQTAIDGNGSGARVVMELNGETSAAVISAEAIGAQLMLEDVPADLQYHFPDGLPSGTGSKSGTPETSTPLTLRLSLLDTLRRAVGAKLEMFDGGHLFLMQDGTAFPSIVGFLQQS